MSRLRLIWAGLVELWCGWTHGGGHIERDPLGRVNWQCNKCGRWADPVPDGVPAAPAPVVPQGWKLVPIEPTTEMCLADWNVGMSDAHSDTGVSACVWAAMLAAAPAYQPEDEDGVGIPEGGQR